MDGNDSTAMSGERTLRTLAEQPKQQSPLDRSILGFGPPMVRVELEFARDRIMHCLQSMGPESEEGINRALTQAMEAFDYQAEIETIFHSVMAEKLKTAIERAVSNMFHDPQVNAIMAERVKAIIFPETQVTDAE